MRNDKTFKVEYEPMLADGYRFGLFHPAGYRESVLIAAESSKDAVKKFHEGNHGRNTVTTEVL